MTRTTWMAVIAGMACSCESGPGPGKGPVAPQPPLAPAATAPTDASAPAPASAQSVRENMWAHFEAASELQRAVAQGRLADARELASWLETKAEPRTPELEAAARRIREAPDLQTAGGLTGALAGACSACHEVRKASPVFAIPREPSDGPSIEAQMQRHQWAAARLWEGVVGPSDDAWYSGVKVMEAARIDLRWTTNATPNPEAAALADAMRGLANRAMNTESRTARADLFGAMLHTCASCHAIVRQGAAAKP